MFSSDDTLSERQENQPEITQQTFPEEVMIPETSGATQLDAPPSKEDTPKLDFSSNTKKKISLKAGNEEEEAKFLRSSFGQDAVLHSFHKCKSTKCSGLSSSEQDRLAKRSDERFNHHWINDKITFCSKTGFNWLIYEEGRGMFCYLCRKHNVANTKNKSKKFNVEAAVRFKKKAVEDHPNLQQHKDAIAAELLSRVSTFHEEIERKEKTKDDVYHNTFTAIYWLAKEEIANKKFTSLLESLEQLGLKDMRFFQHRSAGSLREMFLLLGKVVRDTVVNTVADVTRFGLLSDEVNDVSNKEQLVTFIKFVNPATGKPNTKFLAASDLLETSTSANAETITNAILKQLEESNINVNKLASFSSDGASVMTGKTNGVAAKLRSEVKPLINIHCICHRLALACADACDSVTYLTQVEKILYQLWSFFDHSAKRSAAYAKAALDVKSLSLSREGNKKIKTRIQKACRTRWLSTDRAIEGIYEDFEAVTTVLKYFKEDGDATATGLLKQIGNIKFVGMVYLLREVLPVLSHVSRIFQEGEISFAAIAPALEYSFDKLSDIASELKHISRLKEDLGENGRLQRCTFLELTAHSECLITSLSKQYIQALKDNLSNRFDGNLPVLTAFKVFDPMSVPEKSAVGFKTYGAAEVGILADHFYQGMQDKDVKKEELICEWNKFKYNLLSLQKEVPEEIARPKAGKNPVRKTTTEWTLEHMMLMSATYRHLCPCLLELAEVCLSLPVSNAWPERGASAIKRLKTRLRSSLKNDMLDALLQVSINTPEVNDCQPLIAAAVKEWLAKPRRKIAKVLTANDVQQPVQRQDASVQVDTQTEDIERVWRVAEALDQEVNFLEQELEYAAALLKLPSEKEDNFDHEWDNSDSELSE